MKTATTVGLLVGSAIILIAASPSQPGAAAIGGRLNPFNWFGQQAGQPAGYYPALSQSNFGGGGMQQAGYFPGVIGADGMYGTPASGGALAANGQSGNYGGATYNGYQQAGYDPYALDNWGNYGSPLFTGGGFGPPDGGTDTYGGQYQQAGYDAGDNSFPPSYSPMNGAGAGNSPNFQEADFTQGDGLWI